MIQRLLQALGLRKAPEPKKKYILGRERAMFGLKLQVKRWAARAKALGAVNRRTAHVLLGGEGWMNQKGKP